MMPYAQKRLNLLSSKPIEIIFNCWRDHHLILFVGHIDRICHIHPICCVQIIVLLQDEICEEGGPRNNNTAAETPDA
jgi:hypothetical protein